MTTSSPARCVAEHLVDEAVCQVTTNPAGDVVWLGAGPAVKVLTSGLAPVVGFEVGTSGTHVTSLAASAADALAVVSRTTLELYSLAGRCIAELDLPESSGPACAAFTGDGQALVWCGSQDDGRLLAVRTVDASTGEELGSTDLPCPEGFEGCAVFTASGRRVLAAGWEPDGEHCSVVARVEADAPSATALEAAVGFSVVGASADTAMIVPHGSGELFRLDLASGRVQPWLMSIELPGEDGPFELSETSRAVFLDERLAILTSEYEHPLLIDLGAADGAPRRLELGGGPRGPSFVCRLGPRSFLTVEAREDGARFRAWALE